MDASFFERLGKNPNITGTTATVDKNIKSLNSILREASSHKKKKTTTIANVPIKSWVFWLTSKSISHYE